MQLPDFKKVFRRASRFVAIHEKVLLAILAIIIVTSGGFWYRQFSSNSSDSPTVGGTYVEGVVADKKEMSQIITRLTKAGLLSFSSDGQLQNSLAEKWSATDDKTQFRFTLSNGVDRGEIISVLQSRIDIVGQADIQADLDRDILIKLPEPNPSFPILMARPLFDYGPYKLGKSTDQTTVLTRNTRKQALSSYINKIIIHSYATQNDLEKALQNNHVDGAVASSELNVKKFQRYQLDLNRYYAVLFNTNKTPFKDASLRKALTTGGAATTQPFTLISPDAEPYKTLAQDVVTKWKAEGAQVELSLRPLSEVTSSIGPSRNFQALLIGIDYGLELDPFYLWHSSQVRATGNNVTGVNSDAVDSLVNAVRSNLNANERENLMEQLHQTLTTEGIALILKQESTSYYMSNKIHFVAPVLPDSTADRFSAVAMWSVK